MGLVDVDTLACVSLDIHKEELRCGLLVYASTSTKPLFGTARHGSVDGGGQKTRMWGLSHDERSFPRSTAHIGVS